MSLYTDGFVIPIPTSKLDSYFEMAAKASQVWREHGALDYKECVLDDDNAQFGLSFHKGIAAKEGETVVFSWIVFESREHRDAVNARVMADPRLKDMCTGDEADMPFDVKRMLYGGFAVRVSAGVHDQELAGSQRH